MTETKTKISFTTYVPLDMSNGDRVGLRTELNGMAVDALDVEEVHELIRFLVENFGTEEKTVPASKYEKLEIHSNGLEATLSRRNEKIDKLEAQIVALREGANDSEAARRAHKKGRQEAAMDLEEATRKMAHQLAALRKDALQIYFGEENG